MSGRRIALLTDPAHPALASDDAALREACAAAGWDARPVQWREPTAGFSLAMVRSCWDYVAHHSEFLAALAEWATRTTLVNPYDTVVWNADKRYLLDLRERGVAIPATRVVAAGDRASLADMMTSLGCEEVVVKPVIGAAGRATWRTRDRTDPRWNAARSGDVLVQPFIPEVVRDGEWSLMYFGGAYSHAVVKRSARGEFRVQTDHGGTVEPATPSPAVQEAVAALLDRVPHRWSYARIDGVVRGDTFLLMEAELIEPELFFRGDTARAVRCLAALDSAGA